MVLFQKHQCRDYWFPAVIRGACWLNFCPRLKYGLKKALLNKLSAVCAQINALVNKQKMTA